MHQDLIVCKYRFMIKSFRVIFITFTAFCSCKDSSNKDSTIFYYPKANVYLDADAGRYYYSVDGASTWDSMVAIGAPPAGLGERKLIEDAPANFWLANATHRQEYAGNLYAIAPANPDSNNGTETEIFEKKVEPFNAAGKIESGNVKPKKQNFLQRLFGKKNKKQKN